MSAYMVLVVDDSKLARISVMTKLAALRPTWKCVEAKDADEALTLIGQSDFDLALLDFRMPGSMDGLELASQLMAGRKDLAVAIISANAQIETIDRAHALNAEFLSKPLEIEAFRAFLDRVISRRPH